MYSVYKYFQFYLHFIDKLFLGIPQILYNDVLEDPRRRAWSESDSNKTASMHMSRLSALKKLKMKLSRNNSLKKKEEGSSKNNSKL